MRIIAVDDERLMLRQLKRAIKQAEPEAELICFMSPDEALSYAKNELVDIAFLDIKMTGMHGLDLAKMLKELNSDTNIIFVTGYNEYAGDAFAIHASGYVTKPIEAEHVKTEIAHLRNPVREAGPRVRIQCFGNFGVFVDGEPLLFSRAKPKELLAYLVHHNGGMVTPAEAAAVLWEDRKLSESTKSNMRNVIAQLINILKENGVDNIFCKGWNSMAVDPKKISCDYYDYLGGKEGSLNTYNGEYMNEYSWAEFTAGYISREMTGHTT